MNLTDDSFCDKPVVKFLFHSIQSHVKNNQFLTNDLRSKNKGVESGHTHTLTCCFKLLLLCDFWVLCFFSVEVQRRLASTRDCRGSTRLRRLVLAAAEVLAGSAIDEKFQAPPLTSDTHSLFLYVAFWFLCRAVKPEYMIVTYQLDNFSLHFIIRLVVSLFFGRTRLVNCSSVGFRKKDVAVICRTQIFSSARLFIHGFCCCCFFKLTPHGRSLHAV